MILTAAENTAHSGEWQREETVATAATLTLGILPPCREQEVLDLVDLFRLWRLAGVEGELAAWPAAAEERASGVTQRVQDDRSASARFRIARWW